MCQSLLSFCFDVMNFVTIIPLVLGCGEMGSEYLLLSAIALKILRHFKSFLQKTIQFNNSTILEDLDELLAEAGNAQGHQIRNQC